MKAAPVTPSVHRLVAAATVSAVLSTQAWAAPIHDAVRAGDLTAVSALIADGIDVNAADAVKETPLIIAALAGNPPLVKLLLANGADVDAHNDRGMTALHAAAYSGDLPSAELLASAGAKIDAVDNRFGVSPLFVAAEEDRAAVVAFLISKGADIELKERHGYTALTHSGLKLRVDAVTVLLKAGAACQEMDPGWLADCNKRKAALGL